MVQPLSASAESTSSVQRAPCLSHHPKKKFFNRIHALITSPKRAIGHAERDGVRPRADSSSSQTSNTSCSPKSPSKARQQDHSIEEALSLADKKKDEEKPAAVQAPRHDQPTVSVQAGNFEEKVTNEQQTLVRPHLKLRIVTWNMHDSLPTGDLTELLGHPYEASEVVEKVSPLRPDHPVPSLSPEIYNSQAPYHLIVIGGQEVPVGYGGWGGPNWTEIIQRWLEGAGSGRQEPSPERPGTPRVEDLPENAVDDEDEHDIDGQPDTPHATRIQQNQQEVLRDSVVEPDPSDYFAAPSSNGPSSLSSAPNQYLSVDTARLSSTSTSPPSPSSKSASPVSARLEGRSASANSASTNESQSSGATTVGTTANTSDPLEAQKQQPVCPYNLIAKERLMGIYVSVWAHRSISTPTGNAGSAPTEESQPLVNLIHATSTGTVTAGLLNGKWGNKGAACIALHVANTRLLFICAHLAAHSDRSTARQQNVKKIKDELIVDTFQSPPHKAEPKKPNHHNSLSGLQLEEMARVKRESEKERLLEARKERLERGEDITDAFDYTFWFGDLNFRLDISRLHADYLIKQKDYKTALSFDQLKPIMNEPRGCFRGFREAEINFAPSYKYDVLRLRRGKTLSRSNTAGSILTLADIRKGKHMSAPVNISASASRATLPIDEEEEEDEDLAERGTIASSRASISSAFSGFEATFDDDGNPVPGDVVARPVLSNPSTPANDNVLLDKAKNFFNLVRSKSSSHTPTSPSFFHSAETKQWNQDYRSAPGNRRHQGRLVVPEHTYLSSSAESMVAVTHATHLGQNEPPTPALSGSSFGYSESDSAPVPVRISMERVRSSDNQEGALRSLSPAHSSSRPRLQSQRSTSTIASTNISEAQQKAVQEKQLEQDSVFDTSSKKRVQSWTDRILYKSTIPVERDTPAEEEELGRGHGSGFLDSLRGVKRTILSAGHGQHTSDVLSRVVSRPKRGMHRVSFSPSTAQDPTEALGTSQAVGRTSNEHGPPVLLRRSTSRSSAGDSSAVGSQQRLNRRFAKLFTRDQQQHRESSPVKEPHDRPSGGSKPPSIAGSTSQDTSPGKPTRLIRSFSLTSRRRSVQETPTILPRTKPSRSYTSPSATSPPFASSDINMYVSPPVSAGPLSSETVHPPKLSQASQAALSSSPDCSHTADRLESFPESPAAEVEPPASPERSIANAKEAGHLPPLSIPPNRAAPERDEHSSLPSPTSSQATSPRPTSAGWHSEPVLRHGQPPFGADKATEAISPGIPAVTFSDPTQVSLTVGCPRASPELGAAVEFKRSLTFSNPFATKPVQEEDDPISQSSQARPTGIPLQQAKTTPVLSNGHSATPAHGGALRQWWNNHLFLPAFLSRDGDSALDDTTPLSESAETTPTMLTPAQEGAPLPTLPPPIIVGPRPGEVHCLSYDSVANLRRMQAQSDHRPVFAVYAIGM